MDIKQATTEELYKQKCIALEQLMVIQNQILVINEELKVRDAAPKEK